MPRVALVGLGIEGQVVGTAKQLLGLGGLRFRQALGHRAIGVGAMREVAHAVRQFAGAAEVLGGGVPAQNRNEPGGCERLRVLLLFEGQKAQGDFFGQVLVPKLSLGTRCEQLQGDIDLMPAVFVLFGDLGDELEGRFRIDVHELAGEVTADQTGKTCAGLFADVRFDVAENLGGFGGLSHLAQSARGLRQQDEAHAAACTRDGQHLIGEFPPSLEKGVRYLFRPTVGIMKVGQFVGKGT